VRNPEVISHKRYELSTTHEQCHRSTLWSSDLFVMAAQKGRPLYFAAVVSIYFFLFFLAYSQRSQIGCLPYLYTWCGLSANLECRSEMCCTRLAEIQDAKIAKNWPSAHHRTILSGYIFTTKACIDNRKNLVKQYYLLHVSSQTVNFGPLTAEICWRVWGTHSKFQQVSWLGFVTAPTSLNGVNQTLSDV